MSIQSHHQRKRWPKHCTNASEGGNRKLGQVIRVTGTYNIHTWVDKSQQRIEACQPDTNQAVHYRRPLQVTLLMKWSGPADGAERKSMGDAGQRHALWLTHPEPPAHPACQRGTAVWPWLDVPYQRVTGWGWDCKLWPLCSWVLNVKFGLIYEGGDNKWRSPACS